MGRKEEQPTVVISKNQAIQTVQPKEVEEIPG